MCNVNLILFRLLRADGRRQTNGISIMLCLLTLALCPLSGCGATTGRMHGDPGSALLPGWEQIRQAAVKAARSTGTWASSAGSRKALADDVNTVTSGRSLVTAPLYDAQTSAGNAVTNPNSTHSASVHEESMSPYRQAVINVMATAPVWEPADGKQYDSMSVLASGAVGHFIGAFITNTFMEESSNQGFTPMIKGSKDGVLVSLNWSF